MKKRWINLFENFQVPFSFPELKIGRLGYSKKQFKLLPQIDNNSLMDYLTKYLEINLEDNNSTLWELVSLRLPLEEDKLEKLLNLISSNDCDEIAYKRWRWILVKNFLNDMKNLNYLDVLLEMNEFWLDLGIADDIPYQFQGIGNDFSPKEFYTEPNCKKQLFIHENWLEEEYLKIVK